MLGLDRVVAETAWPVALAIFTLLGAAVAFVIIRRLARDFKSRLNNQVRRLCDETLTALLSEATEYENALVRLRSFSKAVLHAAFAGILAEDKNPSPERVAALRRLCEDLGIVALWRRRLTADRGRRGLSNLLSCISQRRGPLHFVLRAEAAENLGIICHQPSWPLLVDALDDPNGSVSSAAVRNLARIREPESFAALAHRLESAAQEPAPAISIRSLRMALGGFPVTQAVGLRELLKHSRPRVRLVASEVVALMVQREATESRKRNGHPDGLSAEIIEIFFVRLAKDEDADVRACAADVLAHLDLFRALPVLTQLLGDPAWFVRMHAVRAFRRPRLGPLTVVSERLTDPHWRVREAAARTLFARGRSGVRRLFEHFLATDDRYSQDQVAEEIARAGLLPSILGQYGEFGGELETRFVDEMVLRGFGHLLLPALQDGVRAEKSRALLQGMSRHSNDNVELFRRQWTGSAPVPQSIRESQPADKAGETALDSDSLVAVEAS
jgi:HEAT repeat protein